MAKWKWVTRDKDGAFGDDVVVWAGKGKPVLDDGQWECGSSPDLCVDMAAPAKDFQKDFGLKLKPGSIQKVKFSAEILEGK